MKFKAVIFDLDGVLIHTDKFHYFAWKQIADKIGVSFDHAINDKLRGVSRLDSLNIILSHSQQNLSSIEKELLAEEKNTIYRKLLANLSNNDVHPEVEALLNNLKNMGIKVAIGSSSKNARFILEQTKLLHYFDAISDGSNISRSKPDPEVFLKAAGYLCLIPNECLVVEDAWAGVDAAKAGGFQCAGIGSAADYELSDYKLTSLGQIMILE